MSTLKVNNLQVGQDSTATNNLTWFQPGSPDGTIRLGSGNAGSATTKFTFDKDGNLTCVGNINAASILAPIEGTLDDWIVHAGDTNTKFGFAANDIFTIETAGSERLRINSSGDVGIGVDPASGVKLHIKDTSSDGAIKLEGTGSTLGTWIALQNNDATANSYSMIQGADAGGQGTSEIKFINVNNSNNEGSLAVGTRTSGGSMTERVRIHSNGQVEFKNGSFSQNVNCVMASGSNLEIGATATIKLRTATNERLRVDSAGSVHVGFSGESLYFQNGFNNSNARIQNAGASNNSNIRFLTRSSGTEGERVRIGSDGNVNFGANKTVSMPSGTGIQVYHSANPRIKLVNDTTGNTSTDGFQLYLSGSGVIFDHKENAEMRFYTNALERLRITNAGKVLIGGGSSPSQVGDGQLIVYGDTRLHPAIKADCIDGGSNRANGYTMLADNYAADESLVNIGLAYSSGSLVLSRGCKVSNSSDTGYLSSMDSFAIRPCALRLDDMGALSFHTTENTATTTTDSAVSLTEVFHVDRVGNIYQRITNRYMFFGASNQLKIGIVSSDPVIDATSGHLQLKKNGSTICTVRDDHLQMYGDIKMNNDKGISFINADDNATGETVQGSVLDDYEEGTFVPTWYTESSLISVNYHTQKGFYQKVGRHVYFQVYIRINSRSGGSGNMAIYGLPYTPQDATTHPNVAYGGLTVAYTNSWSGDQADRGLVSSAAGKCYVYCGTSSGTNVNAGAGNLGNGTQFRAFGSYITS